MERTSLERPKGGGARITLSDRTDIVDRYRASSTAGLPREPEFTLKDYDPSLKLRHPRYLGLRRDKDPERVVREDEDS